MSALDEATRRALLLGAARKEHFVAVTKTLEAILYKSIRTTKRRRTYEQSDDLVNLLFLDDDELHRLKWVCEDLLLLVRFDIEDRGKELRRERLQWRKAARTSGKGATGGGRPTGQTRAPGRARRSG